MSRVRDVGGFPSYDKENETMIKDGVLPPSRDKPYEEGTMIN